MPLRDMICLSCGKDKPRFQKDEHTTIRCYHCKGYMERANVFDVHGYRRDRTIREY